MWYISSKFVVFFNDETSEFGPGLKRYGRTLVDILKEEYDGELDFYAWHYDEHGTVYWIFDLNKFESYEKFRTFAENWVESKNNLPLDCASIQAGALLICDQ